MSAGTFTESAGYPTVIMVPAGTVGAAMPRRLRIALTSELFRMSEILYDVHVWPDGQPVPQKSQLCAAATLAPRMNKATVESFNCI